MLYRYAQNKGINVSIGEGTNILSYGDSMTVSEWATSAMQWAFGSSIVPGCDDYTESNDAIKITVTIVTTVTKWITACALIHYQMVLL